MHHWEIEKDVNQLKKDGKLEEALSLLRTCISFSENKANVSHRRIYPAPYEDAAVILRKLRRYDEEIEILENFLSHPKSISESNYTKIAERLEKACILAKKAEKRNIDNIEKVYYLQEDLLFEERDIFKSTVVIVDVETTGLNPEKDEIIEIGIGTFKYNKLTKLSSDLLETYTCLRQPNIPLSPGATRVHGLKITDLIGKTFDDIKIKAMLNEADFLIAHNASFDRNFISKMYPEVEDASWYCSMNGINWKKHGFASKSLQKLLSAQNINTEVSHRGLGDVISVYNLLNRKKEADQRTYLSELLSGFPEVKYEKTKNTKSSHVIEVELTLPKTKKGLFDILFGK